MVRCWDCTVAIVLVILMNVAGVAVLAFGLASAGVLVKFSASARNCRFQRSETWNERNKLKFMLPSRGPRRAFKPMLPKRTAAVQAGCVPVSTTGAGAAQTGEKEEGS